MIGPSPELLAVARRWFKAVTERQKGQLQHFMSRGDVLRFIGSAEGETWFGPAVRRAIDAPFAEIPKVLDYEEVFAEAHEKDGAGWTFLVNRFRFETRSDPLVFHSPLVFVLEDNAWKIVQRHAAIPAPNRDTTGHEHSAIQADMDAREGEPPLSLRIGIHTGDVVQSDDDFFGTVVNKAARITALAGPGEILVSDVTRAMVGTGPEHAFADPVAARLRGLEGDHLLHRLVRQR